MERTHRRWERLLAASSMAIGAATSSTAALAQAQTGDHPGGGRAPAAHPPAGHAPRGKPPGDPGWRGDIRHFADHDWHVWRGGHWVHGPHGGRPGWWWVIGSSWYFYPTPIYPYPNPYEPAPPWTLALPVPSVPPAQFWYFCDESQRYYPYVETCPGGWKQVPVVQAPATSEPER